MNIQKSLYSRCGMLCLQPFEQLSSQTSVTSDHVTLTLLLTIMHHQQGSRYSSAFAFLWHLQCI